MIDPTRITGIILCGGQARRMGGVEKPLQLLHGRPLVAHIRERLLPQVSTIVISANRERESYAQWGDPIVADNTPDLGPMGGLQAALGVVRTPWFFCCPGDAPFLMPDLVGSLAHALTTSGHSLAYPHDGQRAQHLFLLGRTTLAPVLDAFLARGERSVHRFAEMNGALVVPMPERAHSFRNINSSDELKVAHEPEVSSQAAERPEPGGFSPA